MRLSPREVDKLLLHNAGFLAQKRLARGLRLNHPEAIALIATQILEFIRDGRRVAELSRFLGIATNNVAEYQGLIMGLEAALDQGARRLQVYMDSELLVRQMQGRYQVKAPHLKPLFQQARSLAARFESVTPSISRTIRCTLFSGWASVRPSEFTWTP